MPFAQTADYVPPFSPQVQALAALSMTSAKLPMGWESVHFHPYSKFCSAGALRRSPQNAWGVESHRGDGKSITELLVPRLAMLAHVPVAPTFAREVVSDDQINIVSVIPFESILHVSGCPLAARVPLGQTRAHLLHYASTLPFFWWLGGKMDRRPLNRCVDADHPSRVAEFDFESSDFDDWIHAHARERHEVPANLRNVWDNLQITAREKAVAGFKQEDDKRPILRAAFERGLERLIPISESAIDQVLDVVNEVEPIRAHMRKAIRNYLGARLEQLSVEFHCMPFLSRTMSDHLPRRNPTITPHQAKAFRFSFK